jgi:hypothetical protein
MSASNFLNKWARLLTSYLKEKSGMVLWNKLNCWKGGFIWKRQEVAETFDLIWVKSKWEGQQQ